MVDWQVKLRELRSELKLMQNNEGIDDVKLATPITLDFTHVYDSPDEPSGHKPFQIPYRLDPDGLILTRDRLNRRLKKRRRRQGGKTTYKEYELAEKYANRKPISEWDSEELARGRPRNKDGSFSGPKPAYVTMAIHEEAVEQFTKVIKTEMGVATIHAMEQLNNILKNEETDYRGKPLVSASTKLDAAKFLVEHLVGKPKQRIESDVSVKLQSILGSVIVNPDSDVESGYSTAHFPGVTMELATREDSNEQSA